MLIASARTAAIGRTLYVATRDGWWRRSHLDAADGARLRRHSRLGVEHARPARTLPRRYATFHSLSARSRVPRVLRRAAHVGSATSAYVAFHSSVSARITREAPADACSQSPRVPMRELRTSSQRKRTGNPLFIEELADVSRRGPLQRGRASLQHSRDHRREARHAPCGRARGRARTRRCSARSSRPRSPRRASPTTAPPDSKRSTRSRDAYLDPARSHLAPPGRAAIRVARATRPRGGVFDPPRALRSKRHRAIACSGGGGGEAGDVRLLRAPLTGGGEPGAGGRIPARGRGPGEPRLRTRRSALYSEALEDSSPRTHPTPPRIGKQAPSSPRPPPRH